MAARNLATCPTSSCKNSYRNEMEKKPMLVKRLKTRGREVQQQEYSENALIRASDLSGGRGGSRIFFRGGGGGANVDCSTTTPKNHKVLFFFFSENKFFYKPAGQRRGGGAHPLHPPPRCAPVVDSAIQLLNNWGREYSSSPWTNLSTLQGGGGNCENILHTFL